MSASSYLTFGQQRYDAHDGYDRGAKEDNDIEALYDPLTNMGPTTVASVLLFGSIIFATVGMLARAWLVGDTRALMAALSLGRESTRAVSVRPLDRSYISIYIFLHHASLLGLLLFAVYVFENHPPFPHGEKSNFDADELVLMLACVFIFAARTVRRNDGADEGDNDKGWDEKRIDGNYQGRKVMFDDRTKKGTTTAMSGSGGGGGGDAASEVGSVRSCTTSAASEVDLQREENGTVRSIRTILSEEVKTMLKDGKWDEEASIRSRSGVVSHSSCGSLTWGSGAMTNGSGSLGTGTTRSLGGGGGSTAASVHSALERQLDDILLEDEDEKVLTPEQTLANHHRTVADIFARRVAPIHADGDICNPHQTYEWKGLLCVLFLAYQITDAGSYVPAATESESELDEDAAVDVRGGYGTVNRFYNLVRLSVSAFLFMTGYGHTMYFYATDDLSLARVLRVVFRINLAAAFLCLALGNRYIFYNTCPLHTYFFLMVYATMRVRKELNYTKFGIRMKMMACSVAIFLVWDVDLELFRTLNVPFFGRGPVGLVGAPHGPMWEWYYRSHLHHWAAFVGMIYAVNLPITSLIMRKLEALNDTAHLIFKGIVSIALLVALSIWSLGLFRMPKFAYNVTHPYFGFIPLLCYLYHRNLTPYLRERSVGLLKELGFYSLELYLLHHHVFLAGNGQAIMVLLPGYPKVNIALVTCLLLFLSKSLKSLTAILSSMLLPRNRDGKCFRSAIVLSGTYGIFYGLALALRSLGMVNLGALAIVTVISGVLIYQTVIDVSWQEYCSMQQRQPPSQPPPALRGGATASYSFAGDESIVTKISPPLIGTFAVFLLGLTWRGMSLSGAATSDMLLPSACDTLVNDGVWIDVSPCSEYDRGILMREFGVGSYYNCMPAAKQWGWRVSPPSARCRFRNRPAEELQRRLLRRRVVFVGDTMMRNLFHAICRSMGDLKSGGYDASVPLHSDITKSFGDTTMEYRWAPLTVDAAGKLKEYRQSSVGASSAAGKKSPDLVVVGGGAWDRLHVWATDEDQESHKAVVAKLAAELLRLGEGSIPTVWFTPTTINTRALNSEEKRTQMSEDGMEDMRRIYAELGVEDTATFVLDGPAFTRERADESYDGIHYPAEVYDAGAQILANALDWLLPDEELKGAAGPFDPPRPGGLGNPFLGTMMLCFAFVGLLFFDGYFGFSYLASIFVRSPLVGPQYQFGTFSVAPNELYEEAFDAVHRRWKLPIIGSKGDDDVIKARSDRCDDEIQSLLEGNVNVISSKVGLVAGGGASVGGGSTLLTRRSSSARNAEETEEDHASHAGRSTFTGWT